MNITIGHDAELFAVDNYGHVCSVIGLVGGTKEAPSPCNRGALQEDNVMAELNIIPATTHKEFVNNTRAVMKELQNRLAKYELKPLIVPHAVFSAKELNNEQAQTFGCKPDFDAWDHCENPIISLDATNDRYAGGHIHIGVPFRTDPAHILRFVRHLDSTLGIGMIATYGTSKRSKTYGRLGAHRPTPYGVEYRAIDNSWLSDEKMMAWVFRVVRYVATRMVLEPNLNTPYTRDWMETVINAGDMETLREMCNMSLPRELHI